MQDSTKACQEVAWSMKAAPLTQILDLHDNKKEHKISEEDHCWPTKSSGMASECAVVTKKLRRDGIWDLQIACIIV